jgi:hypothetical protein
MSLAAELPSDARAALQTHLSACPACAGVCRGNAATGRALGLAAPEPLRLRRELASEALRRAPVAPHARSRLVASGAGALLIAAVCAWALLGPLAAERLLAMVQAATLNRPTHDVTRVYDGQGRLLQRIESWHSAAGDSYSEVRDAGGGRQTILSRPSGNILWLRKETGDWEVVWGAADGPRMQRASRAAAAGIDLSKDACEQLRRWIGTLAAAGAGPTVSREAGAAEGWEGRIVQIEAKVAPPAGEGGAVEAPGALRIRCYLSPDGARLQRVLVRALVAGELRLLADVWPIEYDTRPAPALFAPELPPDAGVLFRGDRVDPVWERMDSAQRRVVRELVRRLGEAWAAGDFQAFSDEYDFSAGLRYGVKGKLTAEQIRDGWRGMLKRQQGRWRTDELIFDYAVGTTKPPSPAMDFWSIHATRGASTKGYHVYGDAPSSEPGLLVLGRERVSDQEGRVRELGTMLFIKRLDGRYRAILWRPPFA